MKRNETTEELIARIEREEKAAELLGVIVVSTLIALLVVALGIIAFFTFPYCLAFAALVAVIFVKIMRVLRQDD